MPTLQREDIEDIRTEWDMAGRVCSSVRGTPRTKQGSQADGPIQTDGTDNELTCTAEWATDTKPTILGSSILSNLVVRITE